MSTDPQFVRVEPTNARATPSAPHSAKIKNVITLCDARLAPAKVWLVAIISAAVFQGALIVSHHPWLDEWQALLIARQTPTLSSMFAQLHYEGHPQLWYLLLRTIGAVIPAQWVFPATNLLLAAVTWWAILVRSPFGRTERLLLVFNEILLFEALTVSRSTSLGIALIFVALALWRSRFTWMAIALLPLCDFFFGAIACCLIAIRIHDRQDRSFPYVGLALFAACSVVAALGAVPAADIVTDPARGFLAGIVEFTRDLGTLTVPWESFGYDRPAPLLIGLILAPAFLYMCVDSLRQDRLARWLLFAFLTLLLLCCCAVYPIYLRHIALAAVLLIALVWIAALKRLQPRAGFRLWLCLAAFAGLATGIINLLVPFDTAGEAVALIREHKTERKLWFSYPAFRSIAVAGESGISFGNLEQDCSVQLMRWNFQSRIKTHAQFYSIVRATKMRYGSFYLLTDVPLPPDLGRRIARTSPGYDGVQYTLWKVGNGAVADAHLPPCVTGLRRWDGVEASD